MASQTVAVGVFAERRSDGGMVPKNLVGNRIFYNYTRQFFRVIDQNNTVIHEFYPDLFLQFVDLDTIAFVSDDVKYDLIDECEAILEEEQGLAMPEDNGYAGIGANPDIDDVRPSASVKDPTRHMLSFCIISLMLVAIFSIVVIFGKDIIAGVSALL